VAEAEAELHTAAAEAAVVAEAAHMAATVRASRCRYS